MIRVSGASWRSFAFPIDRSSATLVIWKTSLREAARLVGVAGLEIVLLGQREGQLSCRRERQ